MRIPDTEDVLILARFRISLILLATFAAGLILPSLRCQEKSAADPVSPGGAEQQKVEQTVAAFFKLALSGNLGDAAKLAVDPEVGLDDATSANELLVNMEDRIEFTKVELNAEENRAFAISKPVTLPEPQPAERSTGVFVITLVKSKKLTRRGWLIRDIDFESPEEAKEELQRFLKQAGKLQKH